MSEPENAPAVDAAAVAPEFVGEDNRQVGLDKAADLRLQRIEQYQAEALAKADSLAANLGAANGALMRMGYRLEQAIEGALERPSFTLERLEQVGPAIDMHLRLMREVNSLAQFDRRTTSSRHGRGHAKSR